MREELPEEFQSFIDSFFEIREELEEIESQKSKILEEEKEMQRKETT